LQRLGQRLLPPIDARQVADEDAALASTLGLEAATTSVNPSDSVRLVARIAER
jgi:hypothetical protein